MSPSKLYHNNHDGTFADVTVKSGINHCGWGFGAAVGDYDNDGNEDLYVTYLDGAVLYHNNGDGTFTDVTFKARVGNSGGGERARPSATTIMTATSTYTLRTMWILISTTCRNSAKGLSVNIVEYRFPAGRAD